MIAEKVYKLSGYRLALLATIFIQTHVGSGVIFFFFLRTYSKVYSNSVRFIYLHTVLFVNFFVFMKLFSVTQIHVTHFLNGGVYF